MIRESGLVVVQEDCLPHCSQVHHHSEAAMWRNPVNKRVSRPIHFPPGLGLGSDKPEAKTAAGSWS